MDSTGPFANRLRKNVRHLRKWAKREGVTAYRLYDLDIPEYPFAVDWYDGRVHVVEYPRRRALREGTAQQQREEVLRVVEEVLELDAARIFFKTHLPKKWGEEQYEVVDRRAAVFEIEEHGLRFKVNLSDYLDTGIFLDHRPLRAQVRVEVKGRRFLNLLL